MIRPQNEPTSPDGGSDCVRLLGPTPASDALDGMTGPDLFPGWSGVG